jgi:hypothetical protein
VQRTNRFALLDPAMSHGAVLVRTPAHQCVKRASVIENGDAKTLYLGRERPALGHLIHPANRHEFAHAAPE